MADLPGGAHTAEAHHDIPLGLQGASKFGFWFGIWTFLGVLQAMRLYAAYYSDGQQLISFAQSLTWGLADWYLWGLLSPAVFAVTRHTVFGAGRWPRDLATHLLAAPAFAAVQLFLYSLVYRPLGTFFWHEVGLSQDWTAWSLYVDLVHGKLHAGVITYFLLAILYFTFLYHARLRRAEEHRALLSAQLATAQMNALKMQLHPHFLFNTLNAITSLIHTDPEAADRMTTRLGDMLRTTLDLEGVQEVTLRRELDMLSDYLEIQAMRFSDRLTVEIEVDDQTRSGLVPALLLQPLVENAVEHGVAPRSEQSRVSIRARREGDWLKLTVTNDVPATPDATRSDRKGGLGLANTRARLLERYGNRQSLEIAQGREFVVTLRWPFQTSDGGAT